MTNRFDRRASSTNTYSALIERSLKIAQWLGFSFSPGAFWSAVILSITYIGIVAKSIPWPFWPIIGIFTFSVIMHAIAGFLRVRTLLGMKRYNPEETKQLGREISSFSRNSTQNLNDWDRQHADPEQDINWSYGDAEVAWRKSRERSVKRGRYVQETMLITAIAFLARLRALAIYPPHMAIAGARERPDTLLIYLGTIGALLESNHIAEAMAVNRDQSPQAENQIQFHMIG